MRGHVSGHLTKHLTKRIDAGLASNVRCYVILTISCRFYVVDHVPEPTGFKHGRM